MIKKMPVYQHQKKNKFYIIGNSVSDSQLLCSTPEAWRVTSEGVQYQKACLSLVTEWGIACVVVDIDTQKH